MTYKLPDILVEIKERNRILGIKSQKMGERNLIEGISLGSMILPMDTLNVSLEY